MWGNDAATSSDGEWLFVNASNQVESDLSSVAGPHSTATVTDGNWHYVGVINSAGTFQIYVDGAASGSSTSMSPSLGSTYEVIGAPGQGTNKNQLWYFSGQIDDVRIYNYARTLAQIAWDYNRGAPVAWWKFDECQGTIAHDSSGNGINGTITIGGSGTQTSAGTCTDGLSTSAWYNGRNGKLNYSLNFDGTDDYVNGFVGGNPGPGANLPAETVSAWVKPASVGSSMYVLASGNTNQIYDIAKLFLNSAGKWALNFTNSSQVSSSPDATSNSAAVAGQWVQLVGVYNGTTVKLYVNGIPQTTTGSLTGNTNSQSTGFGIGTYGTVANSTFNGQIDDVRIYNYALTATQVQLLYNNGAYSVAPVTGVP